MTAAALFTLWLVHLAAVASPGPAFAVALRLAATEGARASVIYALGVGLGGAAWALAALSGLSLLFHLLPWTMLALKIAGGLFLIWIGLQGWHHARDPLPEAATAGLPRSAWATLKLALLTQIGNPKTAVFFGAVFAALVPAEASLPLMAGLLVLVFVTESLWYTAIGLVFSRGPVRRLYVRAKTALDRLFGTAMIALGLRLAVQP